MFTIVSGFLYGSSGVIVTEDVIKARLRVIRGKDWKWGDQDVNGEGTVTKEFRSGWWLVDWDNGDSGLRYRVGFYGKYDLKTA